MTYRNIPTPTSITIGVHTAVIARDSEIGEYRVRLVSNRIPQSDADYFTDDKDDARHTAWAMVRHAAASVT